MKFQTENSKTQIIEQNKEDSGSKKEEFNKELELLNKKSVSDSGKETQQAK